VTEKEIDKLIGRLGNADRSALSAFVTLSPDEREAFNARVHERTAAMEAVERAKSDRKRSFSY
jgi:hypothetical protein